VRPTQEGPNNPIHLEKIAVLADNRSQLGLRRHRHADADPSKNGEFRGITLTNA
jgi:hypothetical protein